MKKISLILLIIAKCIFLPMCLVAQVKTKIYPNGLPKDVIKQSYPFNEILVAAPLNFEALKESGGDVEKLSEYKNKFAEIVNVDYNLIITAKQYSSNDRVFYSMRLIADKALNISDQFSEFQLSQNAILNLHTDFEITEDITAKENNSNNIWATRIYQGNILYLTLSVPYKEISELKVKINKIGFGFRQIGGGFFGNPGASGNCNINVLCPAGNGWENERNSVALIVSGGNEICTGTLVMNTCGIDVPYLLTANHCLNSNVSNWVFQFQTWSTDCATNTGWREDVQFNGCQLRANNAATDFALVELNQTPQANSGITYSGWTRDPNPAITTTGIHHPMGDLMKICHDFQAPISVPWISGASNHWRASFDQGIVQHGSSGSALYDENHRVLGQLHGNQNNICAVGDNNCFCNIQIPSIGEYGRFDISWTGGGTNATRLSNWLDPGNTGAITTNTTNISNLFSPNPSITGDPAICSGAKIFTLIGVPLGANISWSISNTSVASLTSSGNQATVTKNGNGVLTLTAVIVSPCNPITITKLINIGIPPTNYKLFTIQTLTSLCGWDVTLSNFCNATGFVWQDLTPLPYTQELGQTQPYHHLVQENVDYGPITLNYTIASVNQCGTGNFVTKSVKVPAPWRTGNCNIPAIVVPPNNDSRVSIQVSPNPTTNSITATKNDNVGFNEIRIFDKLGNLRTQIKYPKNTKSATIYLTGLGTDIYRLQAFDGVNWSTISFIKL